MNKRTVHLENNPDPGTLALMLAHVSEGYLTHAVEVRREGEPVAVLLDPEAARCGQLPGVAIADRLRTRFRGQPPFTQDALDRPRNLA